MEKNTGLDRFIAAQETVYEQALAELKTGKKRSHWMWFIFPQIAGLGVTEISSIYAIRDINEATDYLLHPVLGLRLVNCCKALLEQETNDAYSVFGSPDDLKLRSCVTLFDAVPATFQVFGQVLDKFYGGKKDERTLAILLEK